MSNGNLVHLPDENIPDGLHLPEEGNPSVMVLLPRNKYLLGTQTKSKTTKWFYGSQNSSQSEFPNTEVNLYDNQNLYLPGIITNSNGSQMILPSKTVNELKKELFSQMDPPGDHFSTVMIMRTFLRNNDSFNEDSVYQSENDFMNILANDIFLFKVYWALRFALSRGELEAVARIKSWVKVHEVFDNNKNPDNKFKIWFSILETPGEEFMQEIEELQFHRDDIVRMVNQKVSPLRLYNPESGWLILARFGREELTAFFVWAFVNFNLWHAFEQKHLPIQDIILSLWGEYEIKQAIKERSRYKKGPDLLNK